MEKSQCIVSTHTQIHEVHRTTDDKAVAIQQTPLGQKINNAGEDHPDQTPRKSNIMKERPQAL